MAVKINVDPDKPSHLGGLLGGLGMLAGVAAAPFTGGASLGATVAAAGALGAAGNAVGSLAGGVADSKINQNKDLEGGGVPVGNGAIQRRADKQNDDPMKHVTDALNVLHSVDPAMRAMVAQPLGDAYMQGYGQRQGYSLGTNTQF